MLLPTQKFVRNGTLPSIIDHGYIHIVGAHIWILWGLKSLSNNPYDTHIVSLLVCTLSIEDEEYLVGSIWYTLIAREYFYLRSKLSTNTTPSMEQSLPS